MKELFKLAAVITMEGLEGVRNGLNTAEKEAKKLSKTLVQTGQKIESIGSKMSMAITLPVAAMSTAVLKFGSDFDQAMTNSLAIMGNLSDSMKNDMTKAAREVAKTTTYSAKQAGEAYYFLASAGMSAATSLQALPKVAKFAQAGNFDLALATDLVTDAQSALGLSSKDTEKSIEGLTRVSDVLVKANTLANASVRQFSESLTNKAGAAIRLLGKDIEEGVAVLAAFADQGVKGKEAGESLNIVMRDLQRASIENRAAFDSAGVAVFDSSGEMRHMADIVGELEKRLSGMSDEQKRVELSTLGFQERSISATMVLLGTSDAIRNYEKDLRQTAGTTDEVSKKQLESFKNQMILIKNRMVDVGLTIWNIVQPALMDTFIPAIDKGVKKIEAFADWFNLLPKDLKNFAIGMGLAAAAIGPLLLGLGKAMVLFKDLQIVIKSLNVLLLGNPFGIAALAITGIALAVGKTVSAWQKWKAEIGQKVQNKQVEQMKKDLEELIPLYNELALGQDVAARGEENFIAVNKRVKELETNLADLGYEFTGSFINKSIQAEDVLTDLNLTTGEAANIVDDLTTKISENTDSTNTNADAVKALEEEQAKLLERRRQVLEERSALEDEYANKVFEQNANDVELLDKKYREELLRAEELGADKLNIEKWYQTEKQRIIDQATYEYEQDKNKEAEETQKTADRIAEIDKELAETRKRLEREVAEERTQQTQGVVSFISDSFNQLGSILSMFNSNRLDEIDQWEARQREEIENSMLSEEEKDAKLQALEDEAAKRERDAKRRQAKQNKAISIFNIIISTAQAIMKAWTELPWVMAAVQSAVIGTLGTAQATAVAAQPIPLAKGGFVESVPGGVNTIVGEGRQDELVLPLETGVDMMVKKMVEGIGSTDRAISPAFAIGSTTYVTENHYHIGTLVGDDSGYKQLERRLEPYRTSELIRRGQ